MFFIVWAHTLLGWETARFNSSGLQIIQAIMLETGKLGTLSFFLISGYFLSDRIQKYTPTGYIKHRFFSLILPWVTFLVLYTLIELFEVYTVKLIIHGGILTAVRLSFELARSFIFYSAYWFLPMSLLSIVVLIMFKKHVYKLWFAAVLIGCTLFYCINIYYNWMPVMHTKAFMGYTIFIWLGMQVRNHEKAIKRHLDRVSWYILLPAFFLLFYISCHEAMSLMKNGSADPFNTIRFTNILVSCILFFSLLKTERFNWLNYLNPRKYVFGIYLTHCIIFNQLRIILDIFEPAAIDINHIVYSLFLQLAFFVVVFIVTYLTVYVIKNSRIKFIMGA